MLMKQPLPKGQPARETIGERYVVIKQVLEMYDVSDRTLSRWIKDKTLPVLRDRFGHVKIEFTTLDQIMKERNIPFSPLYQQVQDLQKCVERLEQKVAQMGEQLELMTTQAHQDQLQAALTTLGAPSEELNAGQAAAILKQQVSALLGEMGLTRKTSAAHGLAGTLEKRRLPDGTMRLIDFVKAHQPDGMTLWDVKKAYLAGEIQLEVYQREGEAKRNKQEWWITEEQHHQLIRYWQQHHIPYTACSLCTTLDEEQQQAG
jgi:hypothetical protein